NEIYQKILAVDAVSASIYHLTQVYFEQSSNNQRLRTADDLYNSVMNAQYAYVAWEEAQVFTDIYSTDSRLQEVLDTAANYMLRQDIQTFPTRRSSDLNEIYQKILAVDAVSASIYHLTQVYFEQSSNNQRLRTADDLYNSVM